MIRFRRTVTEIQRITTALSNPEFRNAQVLQVEFTTDHDVAQAALPPGFTADSRGRAVASIGRWQSNCVGDFSGGSLSIRANFDGQSGLYVLAMYMDTEQAVLFGRELFGEPKRMARAQLFHQEDGWRAQLTRMGVKLMDLTLMNARTAGAKTTQVSNFNVQYLLASDGSGLADDAIVNLCTYENNLWRTDVGTGLLTLASSPHDAVGSLPVVSVDRAVYLEGNLRMSAKPIARIGAADFLPFALSRMDDWSALDSDLDQRFL